MVRSVCHPPFAKKKRRMRHPLVVLTEELGQPPYFFSFCTERGILVLEWFFYYNTCRMGNLCGVHHGAGTSHC
jgi:hypothetical protein